MPEITHDQFNRFLAAKAPEKPCPECATNHWIAQGRTDPSGNASIANLFLIADDGAVGIASMFCSNCGYMKSYRTATIEAWVKDNG